MKDGWMQEQKVEFWRLARRCSNVNDASRRTVYGHQRRKVNSLGGTRCVPATLSLPTHEGRLRAG